MTMRHAQLDLGILPQSPAAARRLVTNALLACASDVDMHDAALLTSELVTNAVLYAIGPISVRVDASAHGVVVEVEDRRRDALVLRGPRDDRVEGGRGLAIVDAIATSWGVDRGSQNGKCVWFALAGPGAPVGETVGGWRIGWAAPWLEPIMPIDSAPEPRRSP